MFSFLTRSFSSLSVALKQPLTAFCELETAHDDALITKTGHYLSWIRVDGMQRMSASCSSSPAWRRGVPHSEVPAAVPATPEPPPRQKAISTVGRTRTRGVMASGAEDSRVAGGDPG